MNNFNVAAIRFRLTGETLGQTAKRKWLGASRHLFVFHSLKLFVEMREAQSKIKNTNGQRPEKLSFNFTLPPTLTILEIIEDQFGFHLTNRQCLFHPDW